MSLPAEDGIYRILAAPFRLTEGSENFFGPAVTLRSRFGSLYGGLVNDSDHQRWRLTNLGEGRVVFESVAFPGSFASTYVQEAGTALVGLPNPTIWKIVLGPGRTWRIAPLDERNFWFLPDPKEDVSISLQFLDTPLRGSATWGFQATKE